MDKYNNYQDELVDILDTWYIKNGKDITSYKNISLGKAFNFNFRTEYSEEINLVLMIFSFNNINQNYKIFISKNYNININLFEIMKLLKIKYEIIRTTDIINDVLVKKIAIVKDSFLKSFIKECIVLFNNIFKKKCKKRTFFQGYHSTKELIKYLDNNFVTDQLPYKEIIFSSNKSLYFNPNNSLGDKIESNITACFSEANFIMSDVMAILMNNHYLENKTKYTKFIDSIFTNFKKLNIQNAILMTLKTGVSSVISQYIHLINGKVYLYVHGIRDFGKSVSRGDLVGAADGILCWSEFDYSKYKKLDRNLKLFKAGYPYFNTLQPLKRVNSTKNKDMKILILPTGIFKLPGFDNQKSFNSILELIRELLLKGYNKDNIIIKIHGGNLNLEFFKNYIGDFFPKENIVQKENILHLMKKSDIIIGTISTSIYESLFLGIPYILYDKHLDLFNENILMSLNIPYFSSGNEVVNFLDDFKYPDIGSLKKEMLYSSNYEEILKILHQINSIPNEKS